MIYQIVIRVLSPLVLLLTWLDGLKRNAEKPFVLNRLGLLLPTLNATPRRIWIHCASVGEVKAAEPIIKALLKQANPPGLLITSNTASAKRLITSLFSTTLDNYYCPLDYPSAIKRFLKRTKPTELMIVETEIWPNLYQQCALNDISIRIINGRLSEKTLSAPSWLQHTYQAALQNVNQILARSQIDADNFIKLGADSRKLSVLGNLKFTHQQHIQHFANPMPRAYVLAASTHEDEEINMVTEWLALNRSELLVIVPRHPNRSESIQKSLTELNCHFKVASQNEVITPDTQIYLDDRIGFLLPLFEHAQLVIMGGSFVAKGGHNFIEPALYKKAILTGRDYRNFNDEFLLLKAHQGIISCESYLQLSKQLTSLLNHPNDSKQLGENAYQAVQTKQNILAEYLHVLNIQ